MGSIVSIDPRTSTDVEVVAEETSLEDVRAICDRAAVVAPRLRALAPGARADLLESMAAALDAARESLVPLAHRESALGTARLDGELTRTTTQLRLFATVLRDGAYLEVIIDHATNAAPDLRRMLIPLGPVGVFGASNFPFAFSAAGGDTASALAAGCPVIVKAHGAHPALDAAVTRILREAAAGHGLEDVIDIVYGRAAARALVTDPAVQAVGFTGSESAGRMLMDLAAARPSPIPVYAEMGSLNPLVVSPAATVRTDLAATITGSVLLGAGQFCTKPGVVFLPAGAEGDRVVREMTETLRAAPSMFLLSAAIRDSFVDTVAGIAATPEATGLVAPTAGVGSATTAALSSVAASDVSSDPALMTECFGPGALIVRYASDGELAAALQSVSPSLTLSLFAEPDEHDFVAGLLRIAEDRVGRVIFDGVSTGVAVAWSQNHAGPYPASAGGMFTSVGATAIRRFQRPLAYQGMPDGLLPDALRDANPLRVPRRVDGALELSPS